VNTKSKIYALINKNINLIKIDIIDDSYKHVHHKKDTHGGHFTVLIVSDDFKARTLIDRHKLIYGILGKLMKVEIHALSMQTLTEEEYKQKF
jgi:BolA protein